MNYGIPYQGSKNRIAKDIVEILPNGKRFVDLFAGGCAITHAAMLSGKYERFLVNDLYPVGARLFKNALAGEYTKPEYFRWVSREEFFEKKDTDDFIKLCYSFSNNGNDYMYSQKLEPLKKAFHYAVVFDDWTFLEQYAKDNNWREGLLDELKKSVDGISDNEERRLHAEKTARTAGLQEPNQTILVHLLHKKRIDEINERRLKLTHPAYDNGIIGFPFNMVQSIERINRLQSIDMISEPQIEYTSSDYSEYRHEDGDVVYCDPPYEGVWKYDGREFDHDRFWEWVRTRDYPVYVSEYNAPDDFVSIFKKEKARLGKGGNSAKDGKALEQVYIHKKFV